MLEIVLGLVMMYYFVIEVFDIKKKLVEVVYYIEVLDFWNVFFIRMYYEFVLINFVVED